ncbi:MAG: FHA domain-containing protein [Anaerolineae bacterium]|nr:FHA domain-containing protein [Anaerolineae bacterium]MDK1081926.1 FHA domain-containing protein [Anaerolineae bacterium]MDK1118319.1 FHA domain-containing protein [Anaerolineae bacterium]
MKLKLGEIESRLKSLIEVRLVNALPGFQLEDIVFHKLAEAVKENIAEDASGNKTLPNLFTLVIHPNTLEQWQDPKLVEAMIFSLRLVGEETGMKFSASPTISVVPNPEQAETDIEILASHHLKAEKDTRGMTPENNGEPSLEKESYPENAFLIIDGEEVFNLGDMVINIGRRLDNQLILDDPRISRRHAQLRAIKGRYIIFDLESSGGTFINGHRINQSVLYPGDVISIAGFPLVFGQDKPLPHPDLEDTLPINQNSAERPTAILSRKSNITINKNIK